MPISLNVVVVLACAPGLMVVVSLFERRWGPLVAGIVAAAPITGLVGLLLVDSDLGRTASHEMAIRMSGYLSAQVVMATVLATMVARAGLVAGLVLGTIAYAGLAWLAALSPAYLAIVASVLLLGVGRRLVRAPESARRPIRGTVPPTAAAGWWIVALRSGVSLLTATGLFVIARQFGPAAGGAVGAFPVFTLTLCVFVFLGEGSDGVRWVLAGMVRGLPAYFAFVLTYGLAAPGLGDVGGVAAGILVCALCYLTLTRRPGVVSAA